MSLTLVTLPESVPLITGDQAMMGKWRATKTQLLSHTVARRIAVKTLTTKKNERRWALANWHAPLTPVGADGRGKSATGHTFTVQQRVSYSKWGSPAAPPTNPR